MPSDTQDALNFEIGTGEVDPAVFGLSAYEPNITAAPRISRREAIQVPAVKRIRDLIAGTLGALPLNVLGADNLPSIEWTALFEQPERTCPRENTMIRTFEDLLFEGVAWWRIVEFGWHGYPTKVVRLEPRSVQVRKDAKAYVARNGEQQGHAWEWVPDAQLIRFDSPTDAFLDAGARAIRTCLRLDLAAAMYAESPAMQGYFSPAEGADPASDDEIQDLLDNWKLARQARVTGYVPASLKFNPTAMTALDLQLAEQRQHAVKELANVGGIDPEDLGVSTTSRTYQNSQDRKLARINDVLGPYAAMVAARLSMGDVTPRGFRVEFDFNGFLRADDKTRLETYQIGVDMGLYTLEDVARREGLATPPGKPEPASLPATARVETP